MNATEQVKATSKNSTAKSILRKFEALRGQGVFGLAVLISVLLIVAFVVFPAAKIVARSLSDESREQWVKILQAGATFGVVRNTMVMGVIVSLVGTILGLLMALVQVRTRFKFKRILHVIAMIPVISPPFVVAMSIITLFGRAGLISKDLFGVRYDIAGLDGLTLSMSISFMPVAYLNFVGMLRGFDGALEEAATDLGGGLVYRFRTIILPLLAPGIGSSVLLIFVSAIADLGNAVLLGSGYEVLSTRIYLAITGEFSQDKASIYSIMLLAPSLLVFSAQYFWLRKKEYITVTGKPAGESKPFEVKAVVWPMYALATAVAAGIAFIYGYIVVGAFTRAWGVNFEWTLKHIKQVVAGDVTEAVFDTIRLAALSTPLSALAGLTIAFVITQRDFRGRGLLDFGSVLGVAIPGTIIGIGLVLAYRDELLWGLVPRLSGTAMIIVMAFTIRSMPGVVRVAVGALNQLSGSLEEASIGLGASQVQTFRKIILPLIRPAVFSSLVWSFARSMTSLSPIVFLVTPKWRIMTKEILDAAATGRYSEAAATSLVLVGVVLVVITMMAFMTGFSINDGARR